MATPKHTEIDLDMLTDEERAGLEDTDLVDEGLEDGDDNGDDITDHGKGSGTDDADNPEPDGADAGDGKQADEEAAAAAAAAASAEKPPVKTDEPVAGTDVVEPAAAAETAPVRRPWQVPTEVTSKIEELEAEKDRLAELWDDGELTGKEHREKLKALDAELEPLKEQRLFAKVSLNTAVDTYKTTTVPKFLDAHPEYKGGVLRGLIDAEIRNLQKTSADPFSPELLAQAHENLRSQVSKAYGVEGKAPAPKPNATTTAPKREIPPTLGGLPAADATDADDGGEFAYLDRLANQDIEKFETAIAQLSDEKRDRYLSQ